MINTIQALNDFISVAQRSRKYPPNSASGFRAALKLFESVMSEEEKTSIDVFKDRFEQIFQEVYNRNSTKFSAGSLQTYKFRMEKLIHDFLAYGSSADKMASWTPKIIIRKKKSVSLSAQPLSASKAIEDISAVLPESTEAVDRHELSLPSGAKALLLLPANLKNIDAKKIKAFIDASIIDEEK